MAKVLRLIDGVPRQVSVDQEVAITSGVTSIAVTFPASLQTGNTTPRVVAWMVNTIDASPQFQDIVITARSATGFTASWNAPTDSANYKLAYTVPDGFIA